MQIAFIFARGGSKGVPKKNIREVAGKPLIAHSIGSALESSTVGKVVVSTDCDEIADRAEHFGAEILMRPEELARDDSAEIDAWRHALSCYSEEIYGTEVPIFLSVPATSPLRAPEDIDNAVEKFKAGGCDILFGISPSHRNPYLNMVSISEEGLLDLVIENQGAVRRQDVPDVYDVTTLVYAAHPDYIMNCKRIMSGRVGYIMIPQERALDIDTEFDLHVADALLKTPYEGKR